MDTKGVLRLDSKRMRSWCLKQQGDHGPEMQIVTEMSSEESG